MRSIYLVQRGHVSDKYLKLIAEKNSEMMAGRLSQVVDLDYMGSSEFEFGALPKSFREMQLLQHSWTVRNVPGITDENGTELKVFSGLNDEQFAEYVEQLLRLRYGKPGSEAYIHTKESTHFMKDFKPFGSRPANVWWDIENHVIFSFLDVFMSNVKTFVGNSLNYMDQNAKKS